MFVPEIVGVGSATERAVTGEFCHLSLDSPAQVKYAKYGFFPRVHEILNVPAINRKILAEKLGENVTDNSDRGSILLKNIRSFSRYNQCRRSGSGSIRNFQENPDTANLNLRILKFFLDLFNYSSSKMLRSGHDIIIPDPKYWFIL